MRKHGAPEMLDPSAQGAIIFPPDVSPSSSQFQAAQKRCAYLNPLTG